MYHNYCACVLQLPKPTSTRACALKEKPLHREAGALQLESSPCWPQLERSPQAAAKTQSSQHKDAKFKKKKEKMPCGVLTLGFSFRIWGLSAFSAHICLLHKGLVANSVHWSADLQLELYSKSGPRGPCILTEGESQLE